MRGKWLENQNIEQGGMRVCVYICVCVYPFSQAVCISQGVACVGGAFGAEEAWSFGGGDGER